jgi:Tfp pilus assembly ATPase PilU
MSLDQLVASQPVAMQIRESFLSPNGLVLVCGPTGSGKTTTLYAGLSEIWRGSNTWNVVTIEDPIEYQLDFASQIRCNKAVDLDFPNILRSVLRQDPDIILSARSATRSRPSWRWRPARRAPRARRRCTPTARSTRSSACGSSTSGPT